MTTIREITYHTQVEQGSEEWNDLRCDKFTGGDSTSLLVNANKTNKPKSSDRIAIWKGHAELYDLDIHGLTKPEIIKLVEDKKAYRVIPIKSFDDLGATAIDSAYRKLGYHLTNNAQLPPLSPAGFHAQYGHDMEPMARKFYEQDQFVEVQTVGFVQLGKFAGVSPDGLVGSDGGVEFKCLNAGAHLKALDGKKDNHPEHYKQVQWNMFVTGRKWWDYCWYNPMFGSESMIHERIARDNEMQKNFSERFGLIEAKMFELIEKHKGNCPYYQP